MQRRMLVLSAPLALLVGCGFALRQAPNFAFRSIYLQMPEGSSLGPQLIRALQFNPELRVLTAAAQRAGADVILDLRSEQREKVVAGLNAAGQVREFVLRLRLRFRLITPAGRELIPETELLLQREIGFAETAALAKEEEEVLLYRDMRSDMVQQLMRRLAAVTSLNAGAMPPER
jgi:LPS-assembly lipoprotein